MNARVHCSLIVHNNMRQGGNRAFEEWLKNNCAFQNACWCLMNVVQKCTNWCFYIFGQLSESTTPLRRRKLVQNIAKSLISFKFKCFVYWLIYPPVTRKRPSAIRARLGVAGHLSTTLRWGIPLSAFISMLKVKQGSSEYQF